MKIEIEKAQNGYVIRYPENDNWTTVCKDFDELVKELAKSI